MYHGCDYAVPMPEPKHLWEYIPIKRKMCGWYVPKGVKDNVGTGKRQILLPQQKQEVQSKAF